MSNLKQNSAPAQGANFATPLSDGIIGVSLYTALHAGEFYREDATTVCDSLTDLAERVRALELAAFIEPYPYADFGDEVA